MAAKYLHSLTDENPDFRKQLGCMTGVFHIFNRNQIVSRSRIVGHNRKRVPHGSLLFNNGTPERESNSNPSKHQNLDLRDKVKDSMYREARGLSHNVLVELQEPNWYCNEPNELSRSKSCQFKDGFSKFYPRFSYDGQTTTPKQLKEPPRLSLDSKDRSLRTLNSFSLLPIKPYDSKSNLYSRNPKSNDEKGFIHTRPPSVVAKLMGLETFPDSTSASEKDNLDVFSKSSKSLKSNDHCEPIKTPKSRHQERKPISRVHIEPAPWKHRDSDQKPQNHQKQSSCVNKSISVYSEVDKRIKNLEFEQSGKDLRALKQILESMQAVEARKGEKDNSLDHQNPSSENVCSRGQESHIVIMKPGKIIEKDFIINNKKVKDSCKSRKQSELKSPNRRKQNSSSTQEKLLSVSVLDDSPSSVTKHTPNTQKDYKEKDQFEETNYMITSQTNHEKLQKVKDLVQKLKRLNSRHDEEDQTDYIGLLCENTNPNDRYISEIFLASGILLRDLDSFEFHSPGYPVNPELFMVLERTKVGDLQNEKVHRKLIFDCVNEILVEKLNSVCLVGKNSRELLKEVCLEIEEMLMVKKGEGDELERILSDDVARRLDDWRGFYGGSRVVGMEIEWLIFRDLVNELVVSESCDGK